MWEIIEGDKSQDLYTYRSKVPNGWLVRTVAVCYRAISCQLVFLEDKEHKWAIKE